MKILQVNVVYRKGSTGKIAYDIHTSLLKRGYESIVCYGRGNRVDEEGVYKISSNVATVYNALKSRLIGLQYQGSFLSTNKLISIIKKEKPDVIHLQCINGHFVNIYKLLDFLKTKEINTVLTLHAEFMHTGSCPHSFDCEKWKTMCGDCPYLWDATKSYFFDFTRYSWKKMRKAFLGFENLLIVSTSEWILNRAKESPITSAFDFYLIKNGIDTENIFKPTPFAYLKDQHKIKEEKVLLHVTADFDDPVKGSKYFINLAESLLGENIRILLIGINTMNKKLPENCIAIGPVYDQTTLAAYYSMADLFVITSVRETYPTVCIEAISCGTPVVGFDTGGVAETIYAGMGEVVKAYDEDELKKSVLRNIDIKKNITNDQIKEAKKLNSRDRMCDEYINVYNQFF